MTSIARHRPTSETGRCLTSLRFFQLFESLGVLVMIVLVVALVSTSTRGSCSPGIRSLLITAAIIAVPALGMTLALAMGALDLSIGSLQALTACIVAILLGSSACR